VSLQSFQASSTERQGSKRDFGGVARTLVHGLAPWDDTSAKGAAQGFAACGSLRGLTGDRPCTLKASAAGWPLRILRPLMIEMTTAAALGVALVRVSG
jgi:hypothetical protein